MQTYLAALAHASVLQLRDAIRRVTALQAPAAQASPKPQASTAADAKVSSWGEWEETTVDVRQIHA